jgi:hypothetical protein
MLIRRFKKYLSNLAILIEQVTRAAAAASTTAQLHLHWHHGLMQIKGPGVCQQ